MLDLLIRGGTVVDGSGGEPRVADVGISGGRIASLGTDLGAARETIDATGMIVTPGFVDVHTHFDAQATWDDRMEPAVWHGVTTVIMGNCGVGYAPVRPEVRDYATSLMESVEDIPIDVVNAAMEWSWEQFPDYVSAIARKPHAINIATMVPHGNLRVYTMGVDRATGEPTADEIAAMADMVRDGIRAGAVGVSTSRTTLHTTPDGTWLPGTLASEDELVALAIAAREGGDGKRGVLEVVPAGCASPEPTDYVEDVELLIRVARRSKCPVVFSLMQANHKPDDYRAILDRVDAARAEGVAIFPEVSTRPISTLLTIMGRSNPFYSLPSYAPLRDLSTEERYAALASDPALRERLVNEENPNRFGLELLFDDPEFWGRTYPLRGPKDYYTGEDGTIEAIARREGRHPKAIALDFLMENEGRGILMYSSVNWARRDREDLYRMFTHPATILGLGDGGAHLSATVDVSQPTSFLADWVRDRDGGPTRPVSLPDAVRMLSHNNAQCFGLDDRGRIAEGMRADINVIDLDRLGLDMPRMVYDFPLGFGRLDQRANGYVATIVNGEVVLREGELTANRPGQVFGHAA